LLRRLGKLEVRGSSGLGCMELFETDVGDVEVADGLFPLVKAGSKGVRVKKKLLIIPSSERASGR
jgi:hypothetical protein